ncbi:MAG TPA: GNAT family N-acetyltransferase [Symbiobacteriaceae bacterium]
MPATIRVATPDDIERFVPLFLGLARYNRSHHPQDDDFQAVLRARAEDARVVIEPRPASRTFLATDPQGALLGYLWATVYQPGPAATNGTMLTGVIAELYVEEGARGRGTGTALSLAANAWFRQVGVGRLKVEAFAWNDEAISFYRKIGYDVAAVTLMRPLR